jgi:hypothetical protein
MKRWLPSSWFTALVGCLLYLAVTAAFLRLPPLHQVQAAMADTGNAAADQPSWKFANPEFD